jgi:hypothetical protein
MPPDLWWHGRNGAGALSSSALNDFAVKARVRRTARVPQNCRTDILVCPVLDRQECLSYEKRGGTCATPDYFQSLKI